MKVRILLTFFLPAVLAVLAQTGQAQEGQAQEGQATPGLVLSLDEAIRLALDSHPELAAARAQTEAAEARARQDGAWSNPSLFFRLEGAPRDGDAWNGAERLVGLSQEISLWGVRGKARQLGQARAGEQRAAAALTRQELAARVHTAYAGVIWSRGLSSLQQERVQLSGKLLALVERQLEAGDASQSDVQRARLASARACADAAAAAANVLTAEARLASLTGLDRVAEVIMEMSGTSGAAEAPAAEAHLLWLEAGPRAAQAAVDLARSARLPTLEVEAGLRNSADAEAFDLGVSLGLPLWNRGGENLKAARAQAAAARHQAAARRRQRDLELDAAARREQAAGVAVTSYADKAVPAAEAALDAARAAFTLGDISLTEVLKVSEEWIDARQGLLDWRLRQAEARADQRRWR